MDMQYIITEVGQYVDNCLPSPHSCAQQPLYKEQLSVHLKILCVVLFDMLFCASCLSCNSSVSQNQSGLYFPTSFINKAFLHTSVLWIKDTCGGLHMIKNSGKPWRCKLDVGHLNNQNDAAGKVPMYSPGALT